MIKHPKCFFFPQTSQKSLFHDSLNQSRQFYEVLMVISKIFAKFQRFYIKNIVNILTCHLLTPAVVMVRSQEKRIDPRVTRHNTLLPNY